MADGATVDPNGNPMPAVDSSGGFLSSVGSFIQKLAPVKFPLKNVLFDYASYDYILGISVLSDDQLANPDSTYMQTRLPLIAKSANTDPSNRINTPFGRFDFFIDNVSIDHQMNLDHLHLTNAVKLEFEITEPYSMGLFYIAIEQAAQQYGHNNWPVAPFVMSIQFRGNKENGQLENIPQATRYIPFKFIKTEMQVSERGCIYKCEAMILNHGITSAKDSNIPTPISISGRTVQETLQTGENSLQAVVNRILKQKVTDGLVKVADEVVILFPKNVASASTDASGGAALGATVSPSATASALNVKLGVTRSSKNSTLIQTAADCNDIGLADMGYGDTKSGSTPVTGPKNVYKADFKVDIRANVLNDTKVGEHRFQKNSSIMNIINQVILSSEYPKQALAKGAVTAEGYRKWWRIDTQMYNISTTDNETTTGEKPRLLVYRVSFYNVHTSRLMPTNTKAPGLDGPLLLQAVKEYNYIYTGKNTDIINFAINFDLTFRGKLPAKSLSTTGDVQNQAVTAGADQTKDNIKPLPEGNPIDTSKSGGEIPNKLNPAHTTTWWDQLGGGGTEDEKNRAAKYFATAATQPAEMLNLDMKIIGDPYFLGHSGWGNYVSKPTNYVNLNADGSVNYQNGEVDIAVYFRSPIDIDPGTGLYNYGGFSKSAAVTHWSGLYWVTAAHSEFRSGQFTQTLTATRRQGQFLQGPGQVGKIFSVGNTSTKPANTTDPTSDAWRAAYDRGDVPQA
jgi:hypothetical protein